MDYPSEVCPESNETSVHCVGLQTNADALDSLFASSIPYLRRTARGLLPNPQDSEDALQEAMLSAYRKLHQFRGGAKFTTWLHRIVINVSLRKLQRLRSRPTSSIDADGLGESAKPYASLLVDPRRNPEEAYARQERFGILAAVLEDLPAAYRTVILLIDIDGLAGKEAAKRLGITVSALKARHHRARKSMVSKMHGQLD